FDQLLEDRRRLRLLARLDVQDGRLLEEAPLAVAGRRRRELVDRLEKLRRASVLTGFVEQQCRLLAVVLLELDLAGRRQVARLEVEAGGATKVPHLLGEPGGEIVVAALQIHVIGPFPVPGQAVEVPGLVVVSGARSLLRPFRVFRGCRNRWLPRSWVV